MLENSSSVLAMAAIGAVTGLLTGLTGASGMSVLISSLLLLGYPIQEVIGLTFVVTFANSFAAMTVYGRQQQVEWSVVVCLSIPAMIGVIVGHRVAASVPSTALTVVMIVCLLVVGIRFLAGKGPAGNESPSNPKAFSFQAALWLIAAGCLLGAIMGMMGGGGAIFISLGLILLFRMPAKQAIGVSIAVMGLAALPGIVLHYRDQTLHADAALLILAFSLPVAWQSSRLANRISSRHVLRILGLYLTLISLLLLARVSYSWWIA